MPATGIARFLTFASNYALLSVLPHHLANWSKGLDLPGIEQDPLGADALQEGLVL